MRSSPWLYSSGRNFKSLRQIFQLLKCISYFHNLFYTIPYDIMKIFRILSLYYKNNLFKSCKISIINRKINNNMSIFIYWINLFHSTVTASHSGCHNYKYRFLHLLYTSRLNSVPFNLICLHFQRKTASISAIDNRILWLVGIIYNTEFAIFYICMYFHIEICTKPLM